MLLRYILLPALVALGLLAFSAPGASAASATLTMDPATVNADPNGEFTVTLKVNSDVDLGGVQTNIIFDRQVVQIVNVVPAGPWSSALFLVGQAPQTKEQAIAQANNDTGKLLGVATFFSANAGSVPAGPSDFLTLSMKAVAGGTSQIAFTPEPLFLVRALDSTQNVVPLTTTAGTVNVSGAGVTPTPEGQTPTPSPTATVAAPTPTPTSALPVQATLSLSPASLAVRPSTEFSVSIMQSSNIETSGALASIGFDPSLLELISVTRGTGYKNGTIIYGIVPAGQTAPPIAAKIASANAAGKLEGLSVFLSPPNKAPAGSLEVAVLKFKSRASTGISPMTLSSAEVINSVGENVGVTATNGQIEVSTTAAALPSTGGLPQQGSSTAAGLALAGALALLIGATAVWYARRSAA